MKAGGFASRRGATRLPGVLPLIFLFDRARHTG
jgi:hypothetical protein